METHSTRLPAETNHVQGAHWWNQRA